MKARGTHVYVIGAHVEALLIVNNRGDHHFPHEACICALYPYDATVCFFLKRVTDRYLLFFFTAVPVTPHMEEVTNLLNTPTTTSILPLTNNGGETLHLWAFSPETSRIWQEKLGVTLPKQMNILTRHVPARFGITYRRVKLGTPALRRVAVECARLPRTPAGDHPFDSCPICIIPERK